MRNCIYCGVELGRKSFYTCAKCKGLRQRKPKAEKKCAKEGCENTFTANYHNKKYCSTSCAASVNNLGVRRHGMIKQCCECGKDIEGRKKKYCSYECRYSLEKRRKYSETSIKIATRTNIRTTSDRPAGNALSGKSIEDMDHDSRRMQVIIEQNYTCNRCGLKEWREMPIMLELEHKDGNNQNNFRNNLEALCPNCHSQTPTWRGRNITRKRVSDEILMEALRSSPSHRQALITVGMTPKGGNYVRIKRLAEEMKKLDEKVNRG